MIIDGKHACLYRIVRNHPNLKVSIETVRRRLQKITKERGLTMQDVEEAITTPPEVMFAKGWETRRGKANSPSTPKPSLEWSHIAPFNAPCKTVGHYR